MSAQGWQSVGEKKHKVPTNKNVFWFFHNIKRVNCIFLKSKTRIIMEKKQI